MGVRPLVSVITPTLNQGRFIGATLASVEAQTYAGLEHIVVDGGSTDDTLATLRRHERVVWRSEPDRGTADALNKGLRLARGEIIGWLNSDDLYTPETVETAVAFLERHDDVALVYGDCATVNESGRALDVVRPGPYCLRWLLAHDGGIPQCTVFFRRGLAEAVGSFDTTLRLVVDIDFWIRVARRHRIAYVPGLRASARIQPASLSSRYWARFDGEMGGVLSRFFADPSLPPEMSRLRREAESGMSVAAGILAYNFGDRATARRLLLAGLRRYPNPLRRRTLKAALLLFDTLTGTALGRRLRLFVHRRHVRQDRRTTW